MVERLLKRPWVWVCLATVAGCSPPPPAPAPSSPSTPSPSSAVGETRELVFLLRPGATSYYAGPNGEPAGLDYDLAKLFAKSRGLSLRVVPADDPQQLLAQPADGAIHIAAGGLYRPQDELATVLSAAPRSVSALTTTRADTTAPAVTTASSITTEPAANNAPAVIYTQSYDTVEPVLIFNTDAYKPADWSDLAHEVVGFVAGTGLESVLSTIRAKHPDVQWSTATDPSALSLIAQVADGEPSYAIVDSNDAAIARNVFLDVATAFTVGPKQELVWVLPAAQTKLRDQVDAFFAESKKNGMLRRLHDRYFSFVDRVERVDATVFQERVHSVLPVYRKLFNRAQEASDIEWRLLAAIAYQESHWDPLASSPTNVRGIMMLTEETARRMQVSERLDARQSIVAGAKYLAELKRNLPKAASEPDRTWLALAAFNVGIAHLEDARILAIQRKLNPNAWSDLKKTLPLLAQQDIAANTKYGFARGGQAVVFVESVRAYYDVLLRLEEPYVGLRLRADAGDYKARNIHGTGSGNAISRNHGSATASLLVD